jgi:DNA-binding NarL/FixJ family response regulator
MKLNLEKMLEHERILVAGPNGLMNGTVAMTLRSSGCTDVQMAHNPSALYDILVDWAPTLAVLDVDLALADNSEIVRLLCERDPSTILIVLADSHDDPRSLVKLFVAGIDGVASKNLGIESLMRVIEVVRAGEPAIPRWIGAAVIEALRSGAVHDSKGVELSSRQKQVLRLVAEGLTDRAIAEELNISTATVRSHLDAIFEKTSTDNRTAAARWATSLMQDETL